MILLPLFFGGDQPAAEMAFVQVAAGVFQMRASQVVAVLVEQGSGRQEEDAQETNDRQNAGDNCSRQLVSPNSLPGSNTFANITAAYGVSLKDRLVLFIR